MQNAPEFYDEGMPCGVLTAEPLGRVLDYRAPEGGCWLGAFVQVPLGPRRVVGVVWGPAEGRFDRAKLRQIIRVLDAAPMRAELREFLTRLADYTLTQLPMVLRLATRVPGLADGPVTRKLLFRGDGLPDRMTDARARVMAALDEFGGAGLSPGELAQAAGVGTSVVRGLVAAGALQERAAPRDQPFARLDPARPGPVLSDDQARAAEALRKGQGGYGTWLLKGVTGSGKTEVYLEAVAETLRAGRQALVLLPEIALSAEFLTRVEKRFGAKPAEWHSGVTQAERRRLWRMVGQGCAQMVVGARSALFLPFQNLGLIVVDEEHDTSYKQEEGVFYNARDMAVLRGALNGAQVVLASATPSLETWANAQAGKYTRLDLTTRFGPNALPEMAAIDLRGQDLPTNRWISPTLQAAVTARLNAGEQALLFLNRRGYAPLTMCRACGHQIACTDCDARMVEHRFLQRLVCHQCGATAPIPTTCPECSAEDRMAPVGPGVERLEEEARALWPDARVAVLSSDLFGSARALKAQIEEIAQGGADIIIGTQIVAKGHNFPHLTLVGVIDADLGLSGSDLRAAERVFQLTRQVAGRAGRADKPGRALIQTSQPEHPVIRAILSGDEEAFWQAEADARQAMGMPPYGRLAGIILSGPELEAVFALGNALAQNDAPLRRINAQVFGPAPAPIARIRGQHRVRLLVKAAKGAPLQTALRDWTRPHKLGANMRLVVDIDPQSFY
ncbi:MAG: primosomal protein N' (replication factor Y) PriA [Roseibaca calidilacus]|uniref:Replication restart protein PriA n=1 Tax=Roseibaca calidilacus TaxID=1666912 RepID=A0A0N8K7Q0_9RHOB|nr:primosomal protein N' [Roseibaca calidilacus]KPP92353.1 MAG: primosomal protein N' (replication factor Y) PriA [Roseibaca calidilacus]CUX79648.1 replication restart DNA helicase PriA [Roseibaca calidilacus]